MKYKNFLIRLFDLILVLGLDVPVNNATAVGVLERTEDLDDKVYGILPVQHVFAVDVIFQGNAVNVLHDDILHLV